MSIKWNTLKVGIERGVARILLNRPQALNALSYDLVQELEQAVQHVQEQAKVILIEAAGEHFCAGADLKYLADTNDVAGFIQQINRAFLSIESAPIPVIAAIQGYALAGGFELIQTCDIVLLAENAIIGDQHINFGLLPGAGGSQRLPRLIGRQRALALLLTGDRLNAAEAYDWGLAYRVFPLSQLQTESMSLALRVASKSRDGLKAMKRLVAEGIDQPFSEALHLEIATFLDWIRHSDPREGLRAFRQKRSPNFG